MAPIIISFFFLFVSVAWLIGTYNRFIKYKNRIEEAWSGIDVALKRRFNLIPNLICAIEGYSEHEAKIFRTKSDYLTGSGGVSSRVEEETRILKPARILLTCKTVWMKLRKISKRPEIDITVTWVDSIHLLNPSRAAISS